MQTFLQNDEEQIDGDGAPDLCAHSVGARAVEGFDAQVLFDPFEEQFELEVQCRRDRGRKGRWLAG